MVQIFDEIFIELTKEEREALKYIIKKNIDELENQTLKDTPPSFLAAEVKYDEILRGIIKKIE